MTELSEVGVGLLTAGRPALALGEAVVGVLRLPAGGEASVEGVAFRTDGDELVVRLTRGVSFGQMVAMQRWVLREFPDFLRQPGKGP